MWWWPFLSAWWLVCGERDVKMAKMISRWPSPPSPPPPPPPPRTRIVLTTSWHRGHEGAGLNIDSNAQHFRRHARCQHRYVQRHRSITHLTCHSSQSWPMNRDGYLAHLSNQYYKQPHRKRQRQKAGNYTHICHQTNEPCSITPI